MKKRNKKRKRAQMITLSGRKYIKIIPSEHDNSSDVINDNLVNKQIERYKQSNNFTEVYCNYNTNNRVVPTKEVLSRTLDRAMEQNELLASINADVLARGKRPAVVQSSIKPFAASAGKGLRTAKVHGAYTDAADE